MPKPYTVARGDTLNKIARARLGDARLAAAIADFNGLPDANAIFPGQILQLPTTKDLRPPRAATVAAPPAPDGSTAWPPPPQGFQAIRDTFGDLLAYLRDDGTLDPKWETDQLGRAALPFAIPLAWDTTQNATAIRCHKRIVPLIETVFAETAASGLRSSVKTYGGCYAFRAKRLGTKPSTHAWGIAIDLNPATNQMGTTGDIDPRLVDLFERHGFTWGGRWPGRGKDPMHFQYCGGY